MMREPTSGATALTHQQYRCLHALANVSPQPTVRELLVLLGGPGKPLVSTNGVQDHLRALERKGMVRRMTPGAARSWLVTEAGRTALQRDAERAAGVD